MDEKFYNNMTTLVKRKGVKMGDFEKTLGVSTGYISRFRNNGTAPTLDMMVKITDYLEVSIDSLIGYDYSASTKNLDFLSGVVEKMIKDTDKGEIVWKSYSEEWIKQHGNCISDILFKLPVIGEEEQPPMHWTQEELDDWDPNVYGDEYEYEPLFVRMGECEGLGTCYEGQTKAGKRFYLINSTFWGVEGWDLYLDSADVFERGLIKSVYSTFDYTTEKLLPITRDLVQVIKKSMEDAPIDIELRKELEAFMNA